MLTPQSFRVLAVQVTEKRRALQQLAPTDPHYSALEAEIKSIELQIRALRNTASQAWL